MERTRHSGQAAPSQLDLELKDTRDTRKTNAPTIWQTVAQRSFPDCRTDKKMPSETANGIQTASSRAGGNLKQRCKNLFRNNWNRSTVIPAQVGI